MRATLDLRFERRKYLLIQGLVGRIEEIASLDRALAELAQGHPSAVEVVGEPGIGKTRLLGELAARAEARGQLVLAGSASELEQDLPFSVFVDALDEYIEGLRPNVLAALDDEAQTELAQVFPSLSGLGGGRKTTLQHERYRSYRAVRALLERLATDKPLVLTLDDLHWADLASIELLSALLRRPPAAPVCIAATFRPHHMPERFAAVLERAYRGGALMRIELGAVSPDEARELLGEAVDAGTAALLYEETGGNPFYLEQLRRSVDRPVPLVESAAGGVLADIGVPPIVAAALSEEVTLLSAGTRLVLEGAAVAGDPFEPELASAAAATSEERAMEAIDELLKLDLVRETDVPRRFRFRHPLVRRAVYGATSAAWRLGAHERCADALGARGATAAERAHHVERSARVGDAAAIAILRDAGAAAARLAPASAARWFGGALRLVPETAPAEERVELLLARARALTATGRFAESYDLLREAIAIAPGGGALRPTLIRACAGVEHLLGRHDEAYNRLADAVADLPEPVSAEAVGLMIELALNGIYRAAHESAQDWAGRAVGVARVLSDPPLTAAAIAMAALADAMAGAGARAHAEGLEAAALIDALSDDELARRLDAAAWLGGAELYLDRYVEADAHAHRALKLGRATGQGELFLFLYQVIGRIWYVRGKLADTAELLDGAIEASRLLGNTEALAWNLVNRSVVALAVGDLDLALATAGESMELTRDFGARFVPAWAAVRLAAALLETGEPERAVELMLGSAGGEELTLIGGGWRAYALELLTRCWLAVGKRSEAERTALCSEARAVAVELPLAGAWADRAVAAVALDAGDAAGAAKRALVSAAAAEEAGAPIEAALSRILAGRALALHGDAERAVAELERAAADLDTCGALRFRDAAERELGKLGRRTHRRTRPGKSDVAGLEALTGRELEVARLVFDRKTNREIAEELVLSQKTIETHIRHIFEKLNVSSRVAVARMVERADRIANAAPHQERPAPSAVSNVTIRAGRG
jgi:DNA-binding NarL/FixJ family response regulator/tetratricopeptide (TPR) repeat protein